MVGVSLLESAGVGRGLVSVEFVVLLTIRGK